MWKKKIKCETKGEKRVERERKTEEREKDILKTRAISRKHSIKTEPE